MYTHTTNAYLARMAVARRARRAAARNRWVAGWLVPLGLALGLAGATVSGVAWAAHAWGAANPAAVHVVPSGPYHAPGWAAQQHPAGWAAQGGCTNLYAH